MRSNKAGTPAAESPESTETTPVKNVYKSLLKGFGWVLIPALLLGYLSLFWDPYSQKLGNSVCDGNFEIRKHAYNAVGNKNSYRFYCKSKTGKIRSITFPLFCLSSALWYFVFSLVWFYLWYGDIYKRRPRE
jgi:hypothetical protein